MTDHQPECAAANGADDEPCTCPVVIDPSDDVIMIRSADGEVQVAPVENR